MQFIKRRIYLLLKRWLPRLPLDLLEAALYRAILRTKFSSLNASPRITKREDVWDFAVRVIGIEKNILFLEFGVHEAYSIKYFASKIRSAGSRFYGFDSFEGLPEQWGNKPAGTFSTRGRIPATEDVRMSFIKGWFQDTLPGFAIDAAQFDAVLIHLDADLYSSTLFVLSQLWQKLRSFYVVFDEFKNHEARALYNFSQCFPCKIEFLAHDYDLPSRVFCRITVTSIDRGTTTSAARPSPSTGA